MSSAGPDTIPTDLFSRPGWPRVACPFLNRDGGGTCKHQVFRLLFPPNWENLLTTGKSKRSQDSQSFSAIVWKIASGGFRLQATQTIQAGPGQPFATPGFLRMHLCQGLPVSLHSRPVKTNGCYPHSPMTLTFLDVQPLEKQKTGHRVGAVNPWTVWTVKSA